MEILKTAITWAKDEVFSSSFFILFGVMFLVATIGFWQLGKTETAKAFVIPTLVVSILLLAIGLGLFFTNKSRLANFETEYKTNPEAFIKSEIARTEKTMKEYQRVVFQIVPIIIVVAALLIIFIDKPIWRAASIATIGLMVVILLVDSNAKTRIEDYNEQLILAEKDLKN